MTEVIGIKFEETGTIEYVVPDRNYAKDDFVVVLDKKDKRLAQVVMENTNFPEVSLPTDLNRVEGLAGERDFARYDENLLKAEKSMGVVADLIAQNQLDMKVVDIVFPLNNSY
ncbi:MAG: signal peptidase II, partial [Streptococcus salivarius]|nr:signal peptidase II [Streptococcus salivarius]